MPATLSHPPDTTEPAIAAAASPSGLDLRAAALDVSQVEAGCHEASLRAGRIAVEGLVTDVLTFEQFPAAFEALVVAPAASEPATADPAPPTTACPADRRAVSTRNGEQLT